MEYDVVVIGAGAAGMMAAGVAGKSGKSVLLLEKMEKPGRKIRISGKGRCNLTNTKPREEFLEHIRSGREFFAPAFDAFDNNRLFNFFKTLKVDLVVERGDRVFPAEGGNAWDIANALERWVFGQNVVVENSCKVTGIRVVGTRVCGVKIVTKRGFERNIECQDVIVCTGGASYPLTGSSGDGYMFAYQTGHTIEEIRPSLVPLESSSPHMKAMEGLHLKNISAKLIIDGQVVREEFGEMDIRSSSVDGAVILRVSRDAVDALIEGHEVVLALDLKSSLDIETILDRIEREKEALPDMAKFSEVLRKLTPKPLVEVIASELGIDPTARLKTIGEEQWKALADLLKDFRLPISDYRPFEQAIITAGGVSLDEVDPNTLQSKKVRGLYFAGEVLDIDGDTGGYNLQVAFSTGNLAGKLLKE